VHVLRHKHESGEPDFKFVAGCVDAAGQLAPPCVVREKGLALVAGERQLVEVARFVIVFDERTMWMSRTHDRKLKVLDASIQALRARLQLCRDTGRASGTRRKELGVRRKWEAVGRPFG
jgi:hypothetical protein